MQVGDPPLPFYETFFFACNHGEGIHFNNRIQSTINAEDSYQCDWQYDEILKKDVTVWIGFAKNKDEYCQFLPDGSYGLMTGGMFYIVFMFDKQ